MRNIFPDAAVLIPLLLAACQPQQDPQFAKVVPSAVVEVRDEPTQAELDKETQIVVLGTGTPVPDAYRAGPSIAVIHKGEAYLFDIGAGSVRNATLARYKYDIPSLYPSLICCVFFTHLHSDHTADYVELAYTLWWRRDRNLRVWGPKGLQALTDGMYAMMEPDRVLRTSGKQPIPIPDTYKIDVAEINDGIVLEKDGMTIEAFSVTHGGMKPAYGYRIVTEDKTVVISGDTAYSDKVAEMSRGADILFHEVISDEGLKRVRPDYQPYMRNSHTTASDLARLANNARPDLLVLTHVLFYGMPEDLIVEEVRSTYDGKVVLANDLDLF
jgi:ribonuclease BN (tRNA processing enzyme)